MIKLHAELLPLQYSKSGCQGRPLGGRLVDNNVESKIRLISKILDLFHLASLSQYCHTFLKPISIHKFMRNVLVVE